MDQLQLERTCDYDALFGGCFVYACDTECIFFPFESSPSWIGPGWISLKAEFPSPSKLTILHA